MISSLFRVQGLVHAGVRHVEPDPLPEGTWNRVGRVDPAEGVQDLFRDVLGMNAIDGVAHILKKYKTIRQFKKNLFRGRFSELSARKCSIL